VQLIGRPNFCNKSGDNPWATCEGGNGPDRGQTPRHFLQIARPPFAPQSKNSSAARVNKPRPEIAAENRTRKFFSMLFHKSAVINVPKFVS
jgi:hypothetical protein